MVEEVVNPVDKILRTDRLPHLWCPGCGIGIAVNCFARALERVGIPLEKVVVVSGIGCSGRVAGYLKLDSFHTTHGRAIPFATGLKLVRPDLKVVVFSGDGDLIAIGGNHFIHAARRNIDITVICINNFNYGMTGGQVGPTTPLTSIATTTPYGNVESPFNLPFLADSSGAVYVARWTTFHVMQLIKSISEALTKKGFTFVEVIAGCPTLYGRRNRIGDGLKIMQLFKEHSEIKNGEPTRTAEIEFTHQRQKIVVGKFIDRERNTWIEEYEKVHRERLGENFVVYEYKKLSYFEESKDDNS